MVTTRTGPPDPPAILMDRAIANAPANRVELSKQSSGWEETMQISRSVEESPCNPLFHRAVGFAVCAVLSIFLHILLPGIAPASGVPHPTARPNSQDKQTLGKEVIQQLVGQLDIQDCLRPMQEGPLAPEQNFRPKEIDLNADRAPEVVIQGSECLCSPTGNCPFWIYRSSNGGYHELLETSGIQRYHFLSSRSHGYLDLVASMHGSAYESTVFLFRFDGERYRLRECYERSYRELDSKGIDRELQKPKVTRISCESYEEEAPTPDS